MNALLGDNGIIERAQITKLINELGVIKEEIELYKASQYIDGLSGLAVYPIVKDEEGNRISLLEHLTPAQRDALNDELKYDMLKLSNKDTINIPTFDKIEYGEFYLLDDNLIKSAKPYNGKLVLYINLATDTYRVICLDGLELRQDQLAYTVIPLWAEIEPQYIAVNNNIYKLYGNGDLKVLGERVANAGISTNELNSFNGLQEFNITAINEQFGNPMALPEKKLYLSCGTAYVIDQNDDLWAWGENEYNKLGQDNSYLI